MKTKRLSLLVAVSQPLFWVNGEAYVGVSTQFPLFLVAHDLAPGESFAVMNRTYLIKEQF